MLRSQASVGDRVEKNETVSLETYGFEPFFCTQNAPAPTLKRAFEWITDFKLSQILIFTDTKIQLISKSDLCLMRLGTIGDL